MNHPVDEFGERGVDAKKIEVEQPLSSTAPSRAVQWLTSSPRQATPPPLQGRRRFPSSPPAASSSTSNGAPGLV